MNNYYIIRNKTGKIIGVTRDFSTVKEPVFRAQLVNQEEAERMMMYRQAVSKMRKDSPQLAEILDEATRY